MAEKLNVKELREMIKEAIRDIAATKKQSLKESKKPVARKDSKKPVVVKEGVRKLIEQMVNDAIDEQISGMGMGMGSPRSGGLAGSRRPQAPKQNFDWNEDLKKVKDPNVSLDDLLKLSYHENEQIKGLAKQGVQKRLFDAGIEVK